MSRDPSSNTVQLLRLAALVVVVIFATLGRGSFFGTEADVGMESGPAATTVATAESDATIQELFEARRSDEVVVVSGEVERLLSDDNEGSRHQRFILRLRSGHTLLVAHNIDLADRVPFEAGDGVRIRGEYEWNEQGGVLHWTHHDPQDRREGGWIEWNGTRYR